MTARFIVLGLSLLAAGFSPQSEDKSEAVAKAKAIFTIASHIGWPEGTFPKPTSPLRVGILGTDRLGDPLDALIRDNTFAGRPVEIRRETDPAKLAGCQIVFISDSESESLAGILKAFEGRPTLLLGDKSGYAKRGVAVNLWLEKQEDGTSRPRWEINRPALQAAGLKASAKLLSLAKDEPGKEGKP